MEREQFNPYPYKSEREQNKKKTTIVAERVKKLISLAFRIELCGAEKLKEIPKNKHLIFLTTHMSDYDMPIAIAALAEEKENLKIAEASTHEQFSKNPAGFIGRKIIGEDNSFSVEFTGRRGEGNGIFNPDNYELMKGALTDGYDMVVAAYYDTSYQGKKWRLPKKGGYGGVYLANITPNSIIVPVAVDIEAEQPFGMANAGIMNILKEKRPKVNVNIGKPLEPKRIENIDKFAEIFRKRKQNILITSEEREIFKEVHENLRNESNRVLEILANLLPQKKQPISREADE